MIPNPEIFFRGLMLMVAGLALGLVSFYRARSAFRSLPAANNIIVGAVGIVVALAIALLGLFALYVGLSPNAGR